MGGPIRTLALAVALTATTATAATPPAGHVNFVACPIIRDTKTVPCWLSEYKGKTYFLVIQYDATAELYPPYLGHKALIEGVVAAGTPDVCGGVVLKPLKISVLPDLDPTCETMLPAEDRYQIADPPRGPGPRYHAQAYPAPPAAPAPTAPYQAKDFTVVYDFDSELGSRSLSAMTQAMTYANAIKAHHVQVTGYAAASLLSDGTHYAEEPWIAEHRAKRLADTLAQIGVPAAIISADWQAKPVPGDGAEDYKLRRAVIRVTP